MKFYLRYGEHEEEMDEREFEREEEMISFINERVVKLPYMRFEAFYGRKLELVPNQIVASYKVKK